MAEELEDKYSRFKRNTGIDLQAEIAAGGGEGGLDDYYTKDETDDLLDIKANEADLDALDTRVTDLEENPSGGVTDHGSLTGLADDDHTQYLNNTRGDARYYTKVQSDSTTDELDDRVTVLEGETGPDLTNYYNKTETNTLLDNKADSTDLTTHTSNTSNPHSVTKTQVGLSNVDNTSDIGKPVSTATQAALDGKSDTGHNHDSRYYTEAETDTLLTGKANSSHTHGTADVTSGTFDIARIPTGTSGTTVALGNHNHNSTYQPLDSDLTAVAGLTPTNDDIIQRKAGAWTNRTTAQVKTDLSLTKADVGLSNVDNTSDANKPVSTATQTALDGKQTLDSDLTAIAALTPTNDDIVQRKSGSWTNRTPGQLKTDLSLTKTDVGLANVDNTSDINKPISTAAQSSLDALDTRLDILEQDYLPVANGTHFNGNGGATVTSLIQTRCRQTRKLLRVISGGANSLQLEWANIWTSNTPQTLDATCEMAGPNSVTVRMSIEYPAGNPRVISSSTAYSSVTAYVINDQVTSGGFSWVCIQAGTNQTPAVGSAFWEKVNRYLVRWTGDNSNGDIAFAAGDYKKSLPVALTASTTKGKLIAVLGAFDSGNSSNRIPYATTGACNTAPFVDWVVDAAGGMPAGGSSIVDTGITTQTNGNTTTSNSTTETGWMKIPYATAITGNTPNKTCVALFGDSLIQGSATTDIVDGEPAGIFVRGMADNVWWRISQAGNQATCYTLTNAPWQMSCAARCSVIMTDMALNDIQSNKTLAEVKAGMQRLWTVLATTGRPVFVGMLTPISESSDSWATTGNQTRWVNGGAVNTTQFPNDDATYLTSIYGQTAMWLSEDGASMAVNNNTVQIGQTGHPVRGILDWRTLLAEPQTSWKWNPGYTADGAHPTAVAAQVQADYLQLQVKAMLQLGQVAPISPAAGTSNAPLSNMDRASVGTVSTGISTGSVMTLVGVSPGRLFYGARLYAGAATARPWTLLIGSDPAKLKSVSTGSVTPSANTISTLTFSTPVWIPAGYLIYLQIATPVASAWGGQTAFNSTLNRNGLNILNAGTAADTVAISTGTVVNSYNGAKWTATTFRTWAEIF